MNCLPSILFVSAAVLQLSPGNPKICRDKMQRARRAGRAVSNKPDKSNKTP